MSKPCRVSDAIRDIKVDRAAFEDALRKLLEQPPAPRALISQKVERQRRQARIRAKLEAENIR
jgi:hypothetical protein